MDLPPFMGMGLDVPDPGGHQRKAHKGRGREPDVLDEHDHGHRADGDEIRDQGGDAVTRDLVSFRELMSPMMRARIFPVGRLSKN